MAWHWLTRVLQAPPIPKIAHEVPWIELKPAQERHKKEEEEVEDDSADLPLSSRRQHPTSSRQGRKLAEQLIDGVCASRSTYTGVPRGRLARYAAALELGVSQPTLYELMTKARNRLGFVIDVQTSRPWDWVFVGSPYDSQETRPPPVSAGAE